MLSLILTASALVAVTVAVHATGIAVLLRRLRRHSSPPGRGWPILLLLLRMVWWLMLLHLAEIAVWALFYMWRRALPDAETAFYFSGVTYTTLGYGDVVLARPWRLLGPVEALAGILMGGLSTGYFFVILSRVHQLSSVHGAAVSTTGKTST